MSAPVAFVDRDGTLVAEPPDEQVDALDKIRLADGVVEGLRRLVDAGYRLVVVSNQDALGGPGYPRAAFDRVQAFLDDLFRSQGIEFDALLVCPHVDADRCRCRKPETGLVDDWLRGRTIDRERSVVVGDRESDLELARRLGLRGFRVAARGETADAWPRVAARILEGDRRARVERVTNETRIGIELDLDAPPASDAETGLAFFDHMLDQLVVHGGFAATIRAEGDLEVDEHHTVEDVGLALGEALRRSLGERRGIARFGFTAPMDESLASAALDLSGRPFCRFRGRFRRERVGELPTEMVPHFFRSLATGLGATLHVEVRGENDHHRVEAAFKAVGRALRQATRREGAGVPSTKGSL